MKRRRFVKLAAGSAVAAACAQPGPPDGGSGEGEAPRAAPPSAPPADGAWPTRTLGRTGWPVTVLALGGQRLLSYPHQRVQAIALIRRAVELGVNYCDTAPKYGTSLEYYGRALEGVRDRVFLASKVNLRDRDGARRQLDESLRLLRTDRVDVLQLHNIRRPEDVTAVFAPDGAYRALREAQAEGLTRFVGVTGHTDPALLLECLRREPFDTLLMALNCADPHHLPFAGELLRTAVDRSMGIVAMKVVARGNLFRQGGLLHAPGVTTVEQAIRYVLSHPVQTALIGCDDEQQLEQNVAIAKAFSPLPVAEMSRLEELTRPYAAKASYFKDWERMPRLQRLRYSPIFERANADRSAKS
jgi:uncharacterized protein